MVKAIEAVVRQQGLLQSKNVSAETSNTANLTNTNTETSEAEIKESLNFGQQRADALSAIAEHFLATTAITGATSEEQNNNDIKSLAGYERCQVVLHLDVDTLKHDHCCHHEDYHHEHYHHEHHEHQHKNPAHLDKQWISLENAKRLSCDASLLTVLEDKDGNILNLGRKTRVVTPSLKRALDIRDETCQFPGCCESRYVDFHHVRHWANGGETNANNLVKLCRFHHRALHQGQYSIELAKEKTSGRQWIFKTAIGQVMEPNPKMPLCTAKDFFERQWPDVNSHTGDSLWMGEVMDYSMAIDGLLARQNGAFSGVGSIALQTSAKNH